MEDMRKLMETVAPLFESYALKDQVYDRFNDLSAHKGNPEVKAQLAKAQECWNNHDQQGCLDALKAGEALVAMKSESVVTEESHVEAVEELEHILDELERLGEQAKYLVRSISREAEQQLSSYGAFDFGSSSNQYDVTLAGFVDDAQSGSYDDE